MSKVFSSDKQPFSSVSQQSGNPCVRNCCLDESDVCLGCFRTLDEILAWRSLSGAQREHVMLEAEQRRIQNSLSHKH